MGRRPQPGQPSPAVAPVLDRPAQLERQARQRLQKRQRDRRHRRRQAEVRRQIVALIPPAAVNGAGAKDADDPTSRMCTDARQRIIRGRTSATTIRRRKKKMLEAFPALRLLETKFEKTDIWGDLQCIEAKHSYGHTRAPGGLARSGAPFEAYRMDFCREPPGRWDHS